MLKVMFICYGNICRSTMAEFLFKELVKEKGQEEKFLIQSSATSREEIGSPVHYGTRAILNAKGIDCSKKRAVQLTKEDYEKYDFFIYMDALNKRDITRIFGETKMDKCYRLLDFTAEKRDVADPWWTGDFNATYTDVVNGLNGFYQFIEKQNLI
ncbi:MAG: low molecular weight phosphotyrosine protein phosphatase [Clostridia bacterium]|nr:low molecular weight phosphotyrosine protein phosphatase [Clostridia bacterium]